MAGRPRKPTAMKKIAGNPGKRKLPENEPHPKVEAPPMPSGLSKEAQKHWKEVVEEGIRLRVITKFDASLLESYIMEYEIVRMQWKKICEEGTEVTEYRIDRNGVSWPVSLKRAPWDISHSQHEAILRGIRSDMGFTPSSRSKVSTIPEDEKKAGQLVAFDGGKK